MTTDNNATPATDQDQLGAQLEADFWAAPDLIRDDAKAMLQSGKITETTSLGAAWKLLEARKQ